MTPDNAGAPEEAQRPPYLPDALSVDAAPRDDAPPFPIVAVGASAGGIEALQGLFRALPPDSGCAFVVVMHLSPDFRSELVSVLARVTSLPVRLAEDGLALRPNAIYVIAPGTVLGIEHGRLRLRAAAPPPGRTHVIDHFMIELAADQRERAIGIVLSGTAADGTLGVKAIQGEGGLTIAQLPSTAAYPAMPSSAVASGRVDLQLAVEAMPEAIVAYARDAGLQHPAGREDPLTPPRLTELLEVLHRQVGVDFSGYKEPMLARRVQRRMGLARCGDLDAYVQTLRRSRTECEALAEDFLINVTEFFREPQSWQVLAEQVLPELLATKHTGDTVRAWVPGCSTGEEAYSLAMLLMEDPQVSERRLKLQVFATDLDRTALEVARKGCYPRTIEASVSPQRLASFFTLDHELYRARRPLRDAITFAAQNLAYDPPFSRIDLVSCRNLLIYLKPELQRRVLQMFHYAMVPGGILALGKSETTAPLAGSFHEVVQGARIFRRVGAGTPPDRVARVPQPLPGAPYRPFAAPQPPPPRVPNAEYARLIREGLGGLQPMCALLSTRDGHVLYLQGSARGLIELPEGEPSSDLFSMLDGALRPHLRAAMHRSASERGRVETTASAADRHGEDTRVRIAVTPLVPPEAPEDLLLITLDVIERRSEAAHEAGPDGEQQALRSLEEELRNTKRDLRLAVEEMEAANEELKVAHEEAISSNEELQSTNEELETSQEELQSVNEELATVNQQLQTKLEELEQVNDDLSNLLASTSIPTLFLDRELRIKRFTPAATRLFRLIGSDLERPLADIVTLDDAAAVLDDARAVLADLTPRAVETRAGVRNYLRRTLPYRTREDQIDGVVITFSDVTEVKQAAEGLRRLAAVMQGSSDAIIVHDLAGRVLAWNAGASAMYGYSEAEALQCRIGELLAEASRSAYEADMARALQGAPVQGIELVRLRRDGSTLEVSASLSLIRDEAGAPQAIALIERDITPRKRAERQLRESEHRFRALSDNAPVLIWIGGADGTLRFVNRCFSQFVGGSPEQLAGRSLAELVHADDVPTLQGGLAALRPGRERLEAQLRLRHRDGAHRWVRCTALLQPEAAAAQAPVVGTLVDVDAQVHSEQLLLEASRHKDEFLAMLGHELRNPLAPIRNAAEVLLRVAPQDQRLNWAHDVLVRQVTHVTRLVDDLLDISLITRGAMQLRMEPVDLTQVLVRAADDVQGLLRSKHHRFEAQLPDHPVWVEGDQIRLTQVFQNLLANAAKYTDEHGEIKLAAWRDEGQVVVRITDSGLGIAPEMISRIFDLFVQDERSVDRSQGGLGIGLALVKHLVVKHGGSVEARSPGLGRGSEFVVRLPCVRERAEPAPPAAASECAPQPGRVLVVDDDRESGESLGVLLELSGYQVRTAVDLRSALAVAASFRPQVLVTDIALPGGDGYEVARRLRALPEGGSALKVIGLSGYARPSDFEHGQREGFAHYFAKPVDPAELERAIAALLAADVDAPGPTAGPPASA